MAAKEAPKINQNPRYIEITHISKKKRYTSSISHRMLYLDSIFEKTDALIKRHPIFNP